MLPKESIEEFKKLYKEHYGEDLNDFVATEAGNRLVRMMELVYKPIPKESEEEYKAIEDRHKKVPETEKVDFVKHLVNDAKVTEIRQHIGDKKFWEMVRLNRKQGQNDQKD